MANQTPLASWLYSKREELSPRFKEFNWPQQWLVGLFDFSTTITWKGMTAEGRGVDEKREMALEKSVAEALERLICLSTNIESVGLAAAGTHDPTHHAQNEALERFYLHQHVCNQVSFLKLSESSSQADEFMRTHPETFVSFYRMKTSTELFGLVCLITSNNTQNLSLGFALSRSLEISLKRAMLEALPSYVWLLDEDNNTNETSLPWHIAPDFLGQILPLLDQNSSIDSLHEIKTPALKQVKVDLSKLSIFTAAPIRVARFVATKTEASR